MFFRCLPVLLGLLLATTGAAEPFQPLAIYGTAEPGFFRERRVQAILVLEQGYYQGQASGERRALLAQRFDRQGRVVDEWRAPGEHRFTLRQQSGYDAAGHLTDLTLLQNESPATDTSRLGQQWRPDTRTHYPASPTQPGYTDRWDARTNTWQRTETIRRWVSHDTTYVRSTRLPDEASGNLARSYPAPGGITRTDFLFTGHWFINDMVLFPPTYSYTRREQGRLVEEGRLLFDDALLNYLRQHPELPAPQEGTQARSHLLDYVAHHAAGKPDVLATYAYDAQGRLLATTTKYTRTSYERAAKGQVRATEKYAQNSPDTKRWLAAGITYTYLPSGLVAREEEIGESRQLAAVRYYSYRYY